MKDFDKHFAAFRKRWPKIAEAADHPLTEMIVAHNTQQRKSKISIYRIFAFRQQSWMIDLHVAPLSFRELLAIEIARISLEPVPVFTRIEFWVVALCMAGVPFIIATIVHKTEFALYLGAALFAYIMLLFFTVRMYINDYKIQIVMGVLRIRVKPGNEFVLKALFKILFITVCAWLFIFFSAKIIIGFLNNLTSILFIAALLYLIIYVQCRRTFNPKRIEKQFEQIAQECEPYYQKMEY